MREIPGITPLRAVAASLVLVSHVAFWSGASGLDAVGPLLARGDSGVAVFFAMSAFLLLRPALDPQRAWPPARYALKRAARILPAYWPALVAVLVVATTLGSGLGSVRSVLAHVFLLQGYTGDAYQGFTQSWSLTTEVTFYVLVPLIGSALRGCVLRGRSAMPWLAAVGVVGVVVQAWSASRTTPGLGPVSTSVVGHAAWFAAGVSVLWWHTQTPDPASRCSPGRACGIAATCYVLVATPLGGPVGLMHASLVSAGAKELLYALIAGCLVHAASCTLTGRAGALVASPAATVTGEISYGVFLWHVLVIQVLFAVLGLRLFHTPFLLLLIPTAVVSVGLAWCSWRFVERPAIAWAHRRRPARTASTR